MRRCPIKKRGKKNVSEADTEIVRLEALEKEIVQQVKITRIILNKSNIFLGKISKASKAKQKIAKASILAQIKVAESKTIDAKKSLAVLTKIALKVDDMPKSLAKNKAVMEVQARVIKQIPELGRKLQDWIDDAEKNLKLWDKEAIEALG